MLNIRSTELPPKILEIAKEDDNIRIVILNGSRANPAGLIDQLSDWDIAYYVRDIDPYWNNPKWAKQFGEIMIMQMPDINDDKIKSPTASFAYLMQFMDDSRIDLTIEPIANLKKDKLDSLSVLLLDKDDLLGELPPPTEEDYYPKPPTRHQFDRCCNEFWWVLPYVAKALRRSEIICAHYYFDNIIRKEVFKMLTWYFGIKTDFKKNPGKCGQYIGKYIPKKIWWQVIELYADSSFKQLWQITHIASRLFNEIGREVAGHFDYEYPEQEAEDVNGFIANINFTY
ncbi:MAG: aminoglycoside 6-adenylyltransferase [Candidatus Zixiibacteriota bacterium]